MGNRLANHPWIEMDHAIFNSRAEPRNSDLTLRILGLQDFSFNGALNNYIIKDMCDLDQGHIVSNMSNWFRRGVWFPKGHELRP